MQRFNEATEYLDQGEKRDEFPDQLISDIAHGYARIKPDDDQPLSTDQMVDLLRRIDNFNGFEAMIVLNDQKVRADPHRRARIIEEHLRSINPQWSDGWFEYDFASSRLRLGGKGLKSLSESGSILSGLQPRMLDISGSEISALWKEGGYAIETLDVRECPLTGPEFLQRFLHLKTLIISPNQFTKDELEFLPAWVEVIERTGTSATEL